MRPPKLNELRTTKVVRNVCSECGKVSEAATSLQGETPKPGSIAVCIECGHVTAYDAQMRLQALTDDEIKDLAGNKDLLLVQKFLQFRRSLTEKGARG
jgi:acetyl-CoA carboxylase beta subunit